MKRLHYWTSDFENMTRVAEYLNEQERNTAPGILCATSTGVAGYVRVLFAAPVEAHEYKPVEHVVNNLCDLVEVLLQHFPGVKVDSPTYIKHMTMVNEARRDYGVPLAPKPPQ